MWELERGGVWNSWKYVGYPASALVSHATIMNDDKGWWVAYAVSKVCFCLELLQQYVILIGRNGRVNIV